MPWPGGEDGSVPTLGGAEPIHALPSESSALDLLSRCFFKLMYSKLLVPVVKFTMTGGYWGVSSGLKQIQGGSKH